jgi:hypothetical protein
VVVTMLPKYKSPPACSDNAPETDNSPLSTFSVLYVIESDATDSLLAILMVE